MPDRTVALVIGGSTSVWEELEAAKVLVGNRASAVIATNYAGRFYRGEIDAWVTLHPECFEEWRDERAERGLNTDYRALMYYGRKKVAGTEAWRQRWNGSSGLFAAQLAFDAMDCAGVILCGVPLDASAGHFHDAGEWALADRYRDGFQAAKADGAQIRSMSGWTANLMGRPNPEWLESLNLSPARPRKRVSEATMRIKMLETHNFIPADERRISVKYLQDQEYTVKQAWGQQMLADKVAKRVAPPSRQDADAGSR